MFYGEDFLAIASGWHDAKKLTIDSGSLGSAVTAIHEATHGRIFSQTTDGRLHRLCVLAKGHDLDIESGGLYTHASKRMFLDSLEAHESAATYLSIQSLPSGRMRKDEYRNLSKEYKQYYDILSKFIDPLNRTSWLRYAFAWTLIHWSFHSKRFEEFFSQKNPNIETVFSIPSPSDRLRSAIDYLRKSKRSKRWFDESIAKAKREYTETGRTLWNIRNEHEWDAQGGGPNVQLFENILTSAAGDWLLSNVPIDSENFGIEKSDLSEYFDNFINRLGYKIKSIYTSSQSVLDANFQVDFIESQARFHASDAINHRISINPQDILDEHTDIFISKLLNESTRISDLYIIFDVKNENRSIICTRAIDISSAHLKLETYSIHSKNVINIVKQVSNNITHIKYILKTSRKDFGIAISFISSLLTMSSNDVKPQIPNQKNTIIYIEGDWTDIYDVPGISVFRKSISINDGQGDEQKPLSLRVAKSDLAPFNYFLSAKPLISGLAIDKFEDAKIHQNEIFALNVDMDEFEDIIEVFSILWNVWDSF